MAGFLYFVRGARVETEAFPVLREAGAAHATEGVTHKLGSPGPGGEPEAQAMGLLVVPEPDPPGGKAASAYDAASQEWAPGPGGKYWVGFERARPPRPQDLARRRQLQGHWTELADGNSWLVPAARRFQATDEGVLPFLALPTGPRRLVASETPGGNGEATWKAGGVAERYMPLWRHVERAQRVFAALAEGKPLPEPLDIDAEMGLAVEALAVNYRVREVEVSLLGLVDDDAFQGILRAVLDLPAFAELLGKAGASGGGSISPGAEG